MQETHHVRRMRHLGKINGSVIELLCSPEGRWLMVVIQMDESYFILLMYMVLIDLI